MDTRSGVVAVIPAYNEAGHVGAVAREVARQVGQVIVVDDGSVDGTGKEAGAAGALVVRHLVNCGLGGAITTGVRCALALGARTIVTLDADGQHLPSEIPELVAPILAGKADVTIGVRRRDRQRMPAFRRVANNAADWITWLLFGVYVPDTQSGFRALSRQAASRLRLRANRMEVSSELVAEAHRQGLRIAPVPISTVYTSYSLSKGQGLGVGLQTLGRLVARSLR